MWPTELQISINLAKAAGVPDEHIIIDPGIGFGKTVEQNLTLLNHLDSFKALGYPILLGTSNKSFIGYTLNTPPEDRLEGTAATVAIGIARGADIIRVHQVKEMSRVAKMTDAIVRERPPTAENEESASAQLPREPLLATLQASATLLPASSQ